VKIKIKRLDSSLPLPRYETGGSVGFDLVTREDTVVAANSFGLVPGNVVVQLPPGYALLVASRSSTPRRTGLVAPHGIGIVDSDYCGPEDEVMVQVWNPTAEAVTVKRGDRIAQGVIVNTVQAQWEEVDELDGPSRGGFGSTGQSSG
jgi:dUTP pyrophosphatase